MASGIDKSKIKRRLQRKHEWVSWTADQRKKYRQRSGLNYETWQAERERMQALADAAAPRGDRGN